MFERYMSLIFLKVVPSIVNAVNNVYSLAYTVQPNSFSKLIPAACSFKSNAQETYLFVSDL